MLHPKKNFCYVSVKLGACYLQRHSYQMPPDYRITDRFVVPVFFDFG